MDEAQETTQSESEGAQVKIVPQLQNDDEDEDDLFGDGGETKEEESNAEEPHTTSNGVDVTNEGSEKEYRTNEDPDAVKQVETAINPDLQSAHLEHPASPQAPIPRKASVNPSSVHLNVPLRSSVSQPSYGLPEGVRVPPSVTSDLLQQGKLLEMLSSLPINLINDALTEYDDAVHVKGNSIRNHGAYLYGVVKRYVNVHERSNSGEGAGVLPMGEKGLTDTVNERLEQLVTSGFCTREEMNEKVKSKIRMLSEKDALFALDELSSVDRATIRNFGSYFMGILNRYMRGDASSKIRPKVDRGRDRYRRDQQQQQPYHSYQQRDRSRDRYTPNRGNDPPVNDRVYDNRQQQPWQQKQHHQPLMHQPNDYSNFQQPPIMQTFGTQQGMMQQPTQGMMHMPPMQPNQQFGYPSTMQQGNFQMMGGQQQQQQQYFQGAMNNSSIPMIQQPQQTMQQSYSQPPGTWPPLQQPQQQMQQPPQMQQQQAQVPVDILGLADKAASAVQALANQNKLTMQGPGPQSFNPPSTMMQQSFSPPPQQPHHQQQQQYSSNNINRNDPNGGRWRNTATLSQLPLKVQYAVQNLVATVLDGQIDEGILGLIKSLPEPVALAALERFASLDKSTMRNKTAYLAGLLRREQMKIPKY